MRKAIAAQIVRDAVRAGTLIKAKRCEKCRSAGRLVGHHFLGYEFDNVLKVQWLCSSCHSSIDHRELRKTADPGLKRVIIEVDSATHQQLRLKAVEVDAPLSAIGRQLFDEWLGGKRAAQQEGAKQ